jgi:hypothetical protein
MDRGYFAACQSQASATADATIDRCDDAAIRRSSACPSDGVHTPSQLLGVFGLDPGLVLDSVVSVPLGALERVTQMAGDQLRRAPEWSPKDYAALRQLRTRALERRFLVEDWSTHFRARRRALGKLSTTVASNEELGRLSR